MVVTRVLVLGSSGRIGRMLRTAWAQYTDQNRDIKFVFQTRFEERNKPDDIKWDILRELPRAIEDLAPFDCMIVLSGITPNIGADFTLNTTIGTACMAAAERLGCPHVLLTSTSAVYGTYSDDPFAESDTLNPVNDYGCSKRDMEVACHSLASLSGVRLCCLRVGNVAGADALLLNGAALAPDEKLRLDRFEDGGTPVRSYIGPESLAQVILSLVRTRRLLPAALNIATPVAITMRSLAEAAQLPFDLHTAKGRGHQYVTLDCRALAAFYKFGSGEVQPSEMVRQWRRLNRR